ncbi:MAG: HD family phosphohydrolase [Lewinella sp.]|uniref:HD family phosphohydrolase n=1 Tax=Lewinella sp. TaxID=2004506 RepID=UPI003D6C2F64
MDNSKPSTIQRLPAAFRPLAFVLVAVAVSFLFPADLRFKYQYEKQQTWRYEDLEAPFDFAIRKTEEELANERQEVVQHSAPVFVLDPDIAKERKVAFSDQFQQQLEQAKKSAQFRDVPLQAQKYLNYGLAFLDRIFQRGIIKLDGNQKTIAQGEVITVLRGNTYQDQTLENVLNLKAAIELITDSLPYSSLSEPEFLLPLLQDQLQANIFYSRDRTQQILDDALGKIVTSRGLVQKGEVIITKNSVITEELYQALYSFEQEYQEQVISKRSISNIFFGYLILTLLVLFFLALYLRKYAPLVYNRLPKLLFILIWLVIFSYLVYLIENTEGLNSYLIPFCIVPIVVKTFYNERLALFTHIIIVLLTGFLFSLGFEFVFLQIMAGMVVVLSSINTRDWSGFFYAILYIFLTYSIGYLGLALIRENSLSAIDWSIYTWLFLNAFLTLLSYPLIPLLERVFGFVSPITLVELMDMNQPLLRDLALKAPGTLQHSLQVGNLAETAARRIGADPLLVKVAALYHDIGKIKNPEYFIENQSGRNPHEGNTPLESAEIIIEHVSEGVRMAKKAGLPPLLIDFIRTHHGDTRTEYFYRKYLDDDEQENGQDEEEHFRYPGPKPRSKEEAILMIADSIEAACKSLKDPTEEELYNLIDKIIEGKQKTGQLKDSVISFRELEQCRMVFRQIMKSVYHVRVAYPEEEE